MCTDIGQSFTIYGYFCVILFGFYIFLVLWNVEMEMPAKCERDKRWGMSKRSEKVVIDMVLYSNQTKKN